MLARPGFTETGRTAPCALARTYQNASFVHMERNCSAWASSAIHQLFCRWLRGGCVSGGFNASTTRFGYQVTFHHFERLASGLIDDACRSRVEICGGDARLAPGCMPGEERGTGAPQRAGDAAPAGERAARGRAGSGGEAAAPP